MTGSRADRQVSPPDNEEISLLGLAAVLLRWRRTIVAAGLLGVVIGLAMGVWTPRLYRSSATFIPEGSEGASSGCALAASQFGVRVPMGGGTWSAPVYVELLRSRTFLEPIALDTVTVAEAGGRRVALMDLLKIKSSDPATRIGSTVGALRGMIQANEFKELGAVKLSVTTAWPSVSLAVANRLVREVNRFNVETRKSQATAERQFAEQQALEAEHVLRVAEDRLQAFLQGNRIIGSPEQELDRDRLQRDVALRLQVYTSLLQSREEAKIREVRDTPVITVIEETRLPLSSEPRRSTLKGLLGGIAGTMLAVLGAFAAEAVARARRTPSPDTEDFFRSVADATPRFLRRRAR